uniref:Uncharacterized protein n=1 Tax=Panagrolaimus sp. JU765 TaxID=591449 RepID=A0AC34PXJ8_9BILA
MILQGIPSNLHAVLSQQQNQSGQNPALILAAQQQALANQQAAVLAAAQQQQQVQAQQKQRAEQQQPMLTSLAWPEHNPAVQIPHFDAETYKRVNIDINYSAIPSGMDLPINNVDTLRFFFNFGVSQAKTILERLARGPTNQALPPNLSNSALLKHIAMQSAAAAQQAAAQEQRGALSAIQQQAVAQQLQALSNPSSSIAALQNQLVQHMTRIGGQAGQGGQMKINDITEAMMLQSALLNPSLAQLRTQSTGHAFIPPNSFGASAALHPLEHELIRPTPVNLQAQVALNALQRSSNASTPNPPSSAPGSANNGHSSSPKVSIPVDPAPRKASSVTAHPELNDLQHRGLQALRSPSLMNEQLQRSLAAVEAAIIGGNSVTVTAGSGTPMTEISTTNSDSTSNYALGAQLSAALYQSVIGQIGSNTNSTGNGIRSGTSTPTTNATPINSSTPSSIMGGIGISNNSITSGKSITTGSSGNEQKPVVTYPSMMDVEGCPTLIQHSEMHYTETLKKNANFLPTNDTRSSPMAAESRRKSGLYALTSEIKDEKKDIKTEKPLVPMINYVNNCLNTAKTQLHSQGVGVVSLLDSFAKPVDFASRPIDPIFREARKSLDRMNPYNEIAASTGINLANFVKASGETAATSSLGNCLIGIAGKSDVETRNDDDVAKTNGHTNHSPTADVNSNDDRRRRVSDYSNGSSHEEIDVCGDGMKHKTNREDDLSSPDEKRLRIASASDDE